MFEILKEKLNDPKESAILLAYIDGYKNTTIQTTDPDILDAFYHGRKAGGHVNLTPNVNGQYFCYKHIMPSSSINEIFGELDYAETIEELYDSIAYHMGLSKEQLEAWLPTLTDSDVCYCYNYRHQDIGFRSDIKKPGHYSMGYSTFMKVIGKYVKSKGLIDKQPYTKDKLSFKRKQDETEIINRSRPNVVYRDIGWIEESNIAIFDLCDSIKKIKLDLSE